MQTFVSTIEHITNIQLADNIKLLAELAAEPQGRGPSIYRNSPPATE